MNRLQTGIIRFHSRNELLWEWESEWIEEERNPSNHKRIREGDEGESCRQHGHDHCVRLGFLSSIHVVLLQFIASLEHQEFCSDHVGLWRVYCMNSHSGLMRVRRSARIWTFPRFCCRCPPMMIRIRVPTMTRSSSSTRSTWRPWPSSTACSWAITFC